MEKQKKTNIRAITSLTVTLSFLVMAFSGVILFFSPKGRVANWSGWTMFGLGKEAWGSVHTMLAIVFLAGAALHVYYNWRVLITYLKKPFAEGVKRSRIEFVTAAAIIAVVMAGTIMELPPFTSVGAFGENVKAYWEAKSVTGPYAHAEDDTLALFAEKLGRDQQELLERLASKGYVTKDLEITVGELAKNHGVAPSTIFAALSSGSAVPVDDGNGRGFGGGEGGPAGAGGLGRKTLEVICAETNIDLADAIAKLREEGVTATGPENMWDLANQIGKNPGDVATLIGASSGH